MLTNIWEGNTENTTFIILMLLNNKVNVYSIG